MRHKFFTSFAFILMGALLFTDCSKSSNATTPTCYPFTVEYGVGNMMTFAYAGNYVTSNVYVNGANSNTSLYTYDAQNRLSTITSRSYVGSYYYDGNNRVDSIAYLNSGTFDWADKYSYNSSGQLAQDQFYNSSGPNPYYTVTYKYPNSSTHNYSSIIYYYPSGARLTSTNHYTYDNKNNPFNFFRSFDPTTTPNNVVTEADSDSISSSTYNYNYTYNSNGYPLTVTYQSGTTTYTTNYTYTNCK